VTAHRRPQIPFYYWPFWMLLLAIGLFVFYGLFTPGWMAVRLVAWVSEHAPGRSRTPTVHG
jgi:hypothetical protein